MAPVRLHRLVLVAVVAEAEKLQEARTGRRFHVLGRLVAVDPNLLHLASPHHIAGSQVGSDNEKLALGRSCL
jgi:hypothetical protein